MCWAWHSVVYKATLLTRRELELLSSNKNSPPSRQWLAVTLPQGAQLRTVARLAHAALNGGAETEKGVASRDRAESSTGPGLNDSGHWPGPTHAPNSETLTDTSGAHSCWGCEICEIYRRGLVYYSWWRCYCPQLSHQLAELGVEATWPESRV